jgi:hypothetical protein
MYIGWSIANKKSFDFHVLVYKSFAAASADPLLTLVTVMMKRVRAIR